MRRDYLAFWGILALTFLIFFTLSTCDDINIGTLHLRPSGLADGFKSDTDSLPDTITAGEGAPAAWVPVKLSADPKRVLIIGDSMLEGLAPRLAAYCDASGYSLYAVVWYSATTQLYGETHLIRDYIDVVNPDYIFISLGGNELFINDVRTKRTPPIQSIVEDLGDIPYLWIGPPNWREDTGINDLIYDLVPQGCFFCSNGMEFERKRDGAHPTAESASQWMDSVIRWMPQHSRYWLPMQPNKEPKARPTRYYLHQPGPLTQRPKKKVQ